MEISDVLTGIDGQGACRGGESVAVAACHSLLDEGSVDLELGE